MRRLFFILLILLLPLRGWAGDAMAIHMALPAPLQQAPVLDVVGHMDHAQGTAHVHSGENPVLTATAGDCAGHGGPDGTSQTDAADCASCSMCQTCQTCQTCHTVAVVNTMVVADHGSAPRAAPQRPAQGFASADGALALKPPTA